MFSTLFVGVDVSQAEHVVCAMTAEGQVQARVRVPNDRPGINQLIQWMETQAAEFDRLAVGVESTSVYHWPLFEALTQADGLHRWQPQWFLINPSIVQGFRKTYVDRAKTDPGDAFLIADTIRFGRLRPAPAPDPRYTALRVVTRHRFHLAQTVSREKNRALNELFCLWGGYRTTTKDRDQAFFSDVFGRASEHVLTQYTPDRLATTPLATIAEEIAKIGGAALKAPDDIAQTLQRLAHKAFRLRPKESEARQFSLVMHLDTIRLLESQMRQLDKAIARDLAAIPQTVTSIDGIGPVFGAGIVAEIGPVTRFPSDDAVAKYAGLTWRARQSGTFDADDRPLTQSGNAYLRYYLIEAAGFVCATRNSKPFSRRSTTKPRTTRISGRWC
jgi:transposase